MSTASALLSLIAPAAPTTSQGSAAVDASMFEGLLASMLGGGLTGDDQGEADPTSELSDGSDLAATGMAAPVQTPLPAPQSLLLISGAELSAALNATGEDLIEGDAAPATPPLVMTPAPAVKAADDISTDGDAAPTADAPATDAPVVAIPVTGAPVAPAPIAPAIVAAPVADTPTPAAPTAPEAAVVAAQPSDPTTGAAPAAAPSSTPQAAEASPTNAPSVTPVPTSTTSETPAQATTTLQPSDKAGPAKPTDDAPQVRPAMPSGKAEGPQVRPPAPVETNVKTAAVPLTRPPAPPSPDADTGLAPPVLTPTQSRGVFAMEEAGLNDRQGIEVARPVSVEGKSVAPTPETLPPVTPAPVKGGAEPSVQPPAPAAAPVKTGEEAAQPLETPVTPEIADLADAVQPPVSEAERKAQDAPRATGTVNLRALADRASRPTETNAAVDTAAPSTPVITTPRTTGAATTTPTASGEAGPAVAADAPVAAADSAATTADMPVDAADLEAAPSAQTANAGREALAPGQSRAAVEATAQIAAQILKRLDGRSTRFEMALMPDDLGRVDVKLDIDSEGRLTARLAFDNPAAATDLRGRVDELRRQLEQQGFQLSDDSFEFTQRDSGSSAFDRGQEQRQGQSRAFAAASRLNTETDVAAQPPRWQSLSLTPAGVDMKV